MSEPFEMCGAVGYPRGNRWLCVEQKGHEEGKHRYWPEDCVTSQSNSVTPSAAPRPAAGEDEGKHFVPDRGHCKYCHKSDSLHLPDGRCPAAGEPSERESAVRIANCVLDKPYIDPDGDECVVARQFLRAIEREAARAAVPAAPDVRKLLDAAMLLRIAARKLKRGDGSAACFADKIADFLKRNGLQGSILRGDSGERKP